MLKRFPRLSRKLSALRALRLQDGGSFQDVPNYTIRRLNVIRDGWHYSNNSLALSVIHASNTLFLRS